MKDSSPSFNITKEQLLLDLYKAYTDARRHKKHKINQLEFEYNLEDNLFRLRNELLENVYRPSPSKCFIIHDPKMREVFAPTFRDRIVHHLLYNYIHKLFERHFIYDSYSCIKGKGTHFGIKRLEHHIRSVSRGYTQPCYVLKIDIRGYFMSINRNILLSQCNKLINKGRDTVGRGFSSTYDASFDFEFINNLMEICILQNPLNDCVIMGDIKEWMDLPMEKSLFGSKPETGLPIGNLTSQLFSNVYLNDLDQYVKRVLKCRNYGRYVDDAFVVSNSKEFLKLNLKKISTFLEENLALNINYKKTKIYNAYHGVPFLGSYLLPFRKYIERESLKRMKSKVNKLGLEDRKLLQAKINSYLGVMSHNKCFCIRKGIFCLNEKLLKRGYFSSDYLKYVPFD